ncbi:MAG: tetratricopeptide repeat protein [Planctomycetes bacterium]|nr:tetratricopeptide repeat protein [Planctomycetota bacterium]
MRELLDDSARRMDAGAFDDQPEVEAQTRVTIGESYRRLGKYTDAEQHFRRALEINRKLSPGDALYTADALAQLAELERLTGRLNEADQHAREVLDMLGRIGGGSRIYGAALNVRGMVEMNRANFPEAETLFRECIARLTAVRRPARRGGRHDAESRRALYENGTDGRRPIDD